jgi:thiol-disulfide isomerase/thioredoxin
MNDEQDPLVIADPAQMRAISRRLILPAVILGAVVVAAALWFVLYGMNGGGSKEATAAPSGDCAASAALAPKLGPFAKGDIAALTVKTDPKPMTPLNFLSDSGPIDLSSFKGKTILLNLWATWCVPCREEMPALDRLQALAGGQDFAVVTINADTARLDRPKAFWKETGLKNLFFYADPSGKSLSELQQSGRLVGLPTSFLIGPDSCEVAVISGPAKWDGADALAMVKAAAQRAQR